MLIEESSCLMAVASTLFLPLSSFHVSHLLLLRVSTECCGARDCSGSQIDACLRASGHVCRAADAPYDSNSQWSTIDHLLWASNDASPS
ncbi:hypothetical protein F5Y04DRAFT_257435 [Hypomontagnella monticulosa]|nr:hypothetical protein F5Y04DRAFT_257435 [Hypomontagnella monticulosa]